MGKLKESGTGIIAGIFGHVLDTAPTQHQSALRLRLQIAGYRLDNGTINILRNCRWVGAVPKCPQASLNVSRPRNSQTQNLAASPYHFQTLTGSSWGIKEYILQGSYRDYIPSFPTENQ